MIDAEIVERVKKELVPLFLKDEKTRIDTLNALKAALASYSPLKDPVDCIQWVPVDKVRGNEYNPNTVAPPEMRLLEISILEDGYTQPVVVYKDEGKDTYTVVDGFHRLRVAKECKGVRDRIHGFLPVVVIKKTYNERVASTIRHNRARGKHAVAPMSTIIGALSMSGWDDAKIAKALGMDEDEILRLKQRTGLLDLFKDKEFSAAWEEIFGKESVTTTKTGDD